MKLYCSQLLNKDTFNGTLQELRVFAQEHRYQELLPHIYAPSALRLTPLLRVSALSLKIPHRYFARGRISRYSAALVWGCVPSPCHDIYIDFDCRSRINTRKAQEENIITHQNQFSTTDYLALGQVHVTTPLRTALDLTIHHHDEPIARRSVEQFLSAPSFSGCTVEAMHTYLEHKKYLPHRRKAQQALQQISQNIPTSHPMKV